MASGRGWSGCFFLLNVTCIFTAILVPDSAGQDSSRPPDQTSQRPPRWFEHSLAKVQPLLDRYGYGAAMGATMLEGMGIPAPGQTLLMASALEASKGRMNIVVLAICVAAAATAGNSIGYAAGRWGGRVVLSRVRVNSKRQHRLDDLFRRRGGIVILVARFLDGSGS